MSPYRTPGKIPLRRRDPEPADEDDWMLIAMPFGIALLRVVVWLVKTEPCSREVLLALAISAVCGTVLGRELARRWRVRSAHLKPRKDLDVR